MLKIWKFHITNHKVIAFPKQEFNDYLKNMNDGAYEFILRKQSRPRSDQQNKYYWAVPVKILSEHLGYLPEETHGLIKYYVFRPLGYESTTQPSTITFEIAMDNLRTWMQTEFDLYCPLPNEVYVDES